VPFKSTRRPPEGSRSTNWQAWEVSLTLVGVALALVGVALTVPEACSTLHETWRRNAELAASLTPEETHTLRATVRRICEDGVVGQDEDQPVWKFSETRAKAAGQEARFSEAKNRGEHFPPSLALFVTQETQRLCGAAMALREGTRTLRNGTKNDRQAAREQFLEATRLDPENLAAWVQLGNTYRLLGVQDKARTALEKAARIASTSDSAFRPYPRHEVFAAHYSWGSFLAEAGETKTSLDQLEKALRAHFEGKLERPAPAEIARDLRTSRELASLRKLPAFGRLLEHEALRRQPSGASP
jgi:tetratricopeptide (TPR) repeat protein